MGKDEAPGGDQRQMKDLWGGGGGGGGIYGCVSLTYTLVNAGGFRGMLMYP